MPATYRYMFVIVVITTVTHCGEEFPLTSKSEVSLSQRQQKWPSPNSIANRHCCHLAQGKGLGGFPYSSSGHF